MHRATFATGGRFGPFGSIGSVMNIAICAALGAFGLIGVVSGEVPWFFLLIVAFLGTVFVRVAVRARRGDFEQN